MKTTLIIGGIIVLGIGFLFFKSELNEKSIPQEVEVTEVSFGARTPVTIDNTTFTVSDLRFATSTDENEKEIIIGLTIPIRVATSTGFTDEEYTMNFDGYNQCRRIGKTKTVCVGELNDDIEQNIVTFRLNKLQEIKEQKAKDFEDEINLNDI